MISIKYLFWKGQIEEGYKRLLSTDSISKDVSSAPESIGLLVFKGDMERAEILFREFKKDLAIEPWAGSLFYLLIGHIRKSQYAKALQILKELKGIYSNHSDLEGVKFYFAQGVAFYSYYKSDFQKSMKWAGLALRSSLKKSFAFGELMARDLLGGALISEGEISQGLSELKKSLEIAKKIGNGGFVSALQISILGFQSRFGWIEDPEIELSKAISDLDVQDTYSLSDLKLEFARQLILKGQASKAEQVLNECASMIYSQQNQRQSATLHHRLALLMYVRGQYPQSLTLLQVASHSLNPKLDHVFIARLEGLKSLILKKLKLSSVDQEIQQSDFVHKRIQARRKNAILAFRKGEDLLGDKIDGILRGDVGEDIIDDKASTRLKRVAESGLWYFLPEVLGLDRTKNYLILGAQPSSVTLYSQGDVVHVPRSIKGLSEKVISALFEREQNKEQLIQKVWGYEYDPLRHDSLVYSLIAQIRKQFLAFGNWVEVTDEGYVLKSDVHVLDIRSLRAEVLKTPIPVSSVVDQDFNFRQNEWFHQKERFRVFSIQDYRKYFSVSNMTAFRDIDGMMDRQWIQRSGYGRATRYHFV